ncbi:hypothetical protein [Bradyrhizobium sp. USDA 10063]
MISLTGNSDQAKVAAAILPETISGGVGPVRDIGKIWAARKSLGTANTPHIVQATAGAVIPSKLNQGG